MCRIRWQYQSHHRCPRKKAARQKSDLKRSKSKYTLRTAKKPGQSNADINAVNKTNVKIPRERKCQGCQKKRSKKSLEYLTTYERKNGKETSSLNGPNATNFEKNTRTSEASQTVNDAKSTVVMEFSTVQKVVQIVDNDSDVNPARAPFKEIVIQKDTTDKKYDYNVEQNFATDVTTPENF
ncbi:PREDICTED: uncharacterized protein LOC106741738 [Dinoponera quadriceps]|uniref:Uncharacterized protein LOC106741738 n=1 Tax=Dinoponera quadriceps TaxID=609295 RepID=A0A6P3WTM6_DINQU|nr:PREDICTED: uncharacterized protein LOC106741738 [Dinoponera quadriceps]